MICILLKSQVRRNPAQAIPWFSGARPNRWREWVAHRAAVGYAKMASVMVFERREATGPVYMSDLRVPHPSDGPPYHQTRECKRPAWCFLAWDARPVAHTVGSDGGSIRPEAAHGATCSIFQSRRRSVSMAGRVVARIPLPSLSRASARSVNVHSSSDRSDVRTASRRVSILPPTSAIATRAQQRPRISPCRATRQSPRGGGPDACEPSW